MSNGNGRSLVQRTALGDAVVGVENDKQTPVVNGDLGYRACVEQDE
jgi:hypothetical protein